MSHTTPTHNPDSPLPPPLPDPAYVISLTPGHPVITIWPTHGDALGYLVKLRRQLPSVRSTLHSGLPPALILALATSPPCTVRDHRLPKAPNS